MTIITDTSHLSLSPCVATIGCFDGVHRGHRYLVEQVCSEARKRNMQSALITFPIHPRQVMQSDYCPQWLTCLPQKQALMQTLDADFCILLPFTHELSMLSAREFMQLLHERYNVCALVIGYDHRFGHNRSEGFEDYCRYGEELGMEIIHATGLIEDGVSISSSLIRGLLKKGEVEKANHYLGYNYYLDGTVVDGFKVGRKLGFPTANLKPSCSDKLIPSTGVYAVYVYVEGERHVGMLNIGHRPTLSNGTEISIEVNIFDFSDNLYHHSMRIEFVRFIRAEQKFDSLELLVEQLKRDKLSVLSLLGDK